MGVDALFIRHIHCVQSTRGADELLSPLMLGGRRGVPRGRPVRPPDRAKQGDLQKGPVYSPMLYRNYIDQQISPCFLQDLQSKWEKEQMQKSYKGVKSERCCEVVTVGRCAVRGGDDSSPKSAPKMILVGG